MNRESIIFCTGALIVTIVVCAAGFSLAAMPKHVLAALNRPAPPESLPDIDIGAGFGKVSVLELIGYYVENPPASAENPTVPAVKRFRGC